VDLESFMDGVIGDQLETANIAGAVVAVVEGGEIILAKGYGFADVEQGIRVDGATTLFRPGSISKLFTYSAIMQLIELGELDLDVDVNDYLTAHKVQNRYPEPITLRHLITHTAGFENINVGTFVSGPEKLLPLAEAVKINVPEQVRPPGLFSSYSNYGISIAGLVVEDVSGKSFVEYVEENILHPLGMEYASFRQPLPDHLAPHMSNGYYFGGDSFIPLGFEYVHTAPIGTASLSGVEMAKFMIAHLQGGHYEGGRILDPSTVEMMQTRLFGSDLRLPGMAHGFNEGRLNGYRSLGHRGDSYIFHSELQLIPDLDLGIYVSYNSATTGTQRKEVIAGIMDRYFPVAPPTAIEPPGDFPARAGSYVGSYRSMNRSYTTIEKIEELLGDPRRITLLPDNTLQLHAGWASMRLVEVEPDLFRDADGFEQIIFQRDSGEEVSHFFLASWPATTMEKLPWWTSPPLHKALLIVCLLVFLNYLRSLIPWPRKPEVRGPLHRWTRRTGAALSVLNLVFVVGFGYVFLAQRAAFYREGASTSMKLLLTLPIFTSLLTIALAVLTALAWRKERWPIRTRVHSTLVLIAAAATVWVTNYYNLLGFNY
jgi:CubicO group peptidase (beta-lactamase class C family)